MRRPMVAGNWKMYKTVAEARHLVSEMVPGLQAVGNVDNVLCPPYTALMAVKALLEGTDIGLGAQNMHWETAGAYTGEISAPMVAELCEYVIIGHSERRQYFGETDENVNRRVKAALAHGLIPIVCVGETLEEREAGRTEEVVSRQMRDGLKGIELAEGSTAGNSLIIAYEPVWAIGTGRAATPQDANGVIAEVIRSALVESFGEAAGEETRVLYGGSVKANNAADFFSQANIDGALVGGASLKMEEFVKITQAARI
ncbi:MAG TPA: triose-phosphate isomerase [Anaerolineales bacterium]